MHADAPALLPAGQMGWFPAYRSARDLKDIVFLKNNIPLPPHPRRTSKP